MIAGIESSERGSDKVTFCRWVYLNKIQVGLPLTLRIPLSLSFCSPHVFLRPLFILPVPPSLFFLLPFPFFLTCLFFPLLLPFRSIVVSVLCCLAPLVWSTGRTCTRCFDSHSTQCYVRSCTKKKKKKSRAFFSQIL